MAHERAPRTYYATLAEALWARVEVRGPDKCWLWHGALSDGYGAFHWQGRFYLAHRAAYFLTHGHWARPGTLHSCDNPPCCNPAHLAAGGQRRNLQQAHARGRHPEPHGEANGKAKLTELQVREIQRRLAAGEAQVAIARDYPVGRTAIRSIATDRTCGR